MRNSGGQHIHSLFDERLGGVPRTGFLLIGVTAHLKRRAGRGRRPRALSLNVVYNHTYQKPIRRELQTNCPADYHSRNLIPTGVSGRIRKQDVMTGTAGWKIGEKHSVSIE